MEVEHEGVGWRHHCTESGLMEEVPINVAVEQVRKDRSKVCGDSARFVASLQ